MKVTEVSPLIFWHPHVNGGAPSIVGTRVSVREIQERMNQDITIDKVIGYFEHAVTFEEVRAALAYELSDICHRWNGGDVAIREGEPFMYVKQGGIAKVPLDDAETAIAAMHAAYAEWQSNR